MRRFLIALFATLALTSFGGVSPASAQNPVDFSKSFSPGTIGIGSVSLLTFTIDNNLAAAVTGLAFTDNLPAGVTIAAAPNATATCVGGTLTANPGAGTITYAGGSVDRSASCTISLYVTSSAAGTYNNTTSMLTWSGGNSAAAAATLAVLGNRPGFSKAFSPSSTSFGGKVRLTFTIDNTANAALASNLTFTDNLPTGLTIAATPNASSDCNGGAVTAPAGGTTISHSVGFVPAGASCAVGVDVVAGATGTIVNVSNELTAISGFILLGSGVASAELQVSALSTTAPTLAKQFLNDPVAPGGSVDLKFTILNGSRDATMTDIAFSDDLDGLLGGLAAIGLPASDVCGAGSSLSGTGMLTLAGGSLAAGASCSFTVTLQVPMAATAKDYVNTTSDITAMTNGSLVTGSPASDTLTVSPDVAPTLTKSFTDDPVGAGGTVTLEFTITDHGSGGGSTGIGFTDHLSTVVDSLKSTVLPASGFCGVGSTISDAPASSDPFDRILIISGANLASGTSCTFQVTLQVPAGTAPGSYTNTTSTISATVNGVAVVGPEASDDLTVSGASLDFSKEFTDDPVPAGDTVTLEFTLVNDADGAVDLTDIAFTDNVNAALTGLTPTGLPMVDVCGTGSSLSGTTSLSFTGGTLAAGAMCTFSVTLQVPAGAIPGSYTNTTGDVTAMAGGVPFATGGASDTLKVAGLSLTKEFTDDPIPAGSTGTLQFTITNLTPASAATGIVFSDNLNAALGGLVAVALPLMDICGAGSQIAGTSTLTFTGGSLAAGASCTFPVTVDVPDAATPGTYRNLTSVLTGVVGGNATVSDAASDLLEVSSPSAEVALSKSFAGPVTPGDTATLSFQITNNSATLTATDLSFTDDLDAMLSGATLVGATGGCGTVSGASVLDLSASVPLAPGASCSFDATVQIPAGASPGTYTNTTSELTATVNGITAGNGLPAKADLVVQPGTGTLSKSFLSPAYPGGSATLRFTIGNTGAGTLSELRFTDDLGAALAGLVASGLPASNVCGGGSQISGSGQLSFTGGTLAGGTSCNIDVTVQVPGGTTPGSYMNTSSSLTAGSSTIAGAASASLMVEPPPSFAKVFAPASVITNQVAMLGFTVDNSASALAASALAFADNLPAGLVVAGPANASTTCTGGTLTATAGAGVISYSGGSVGAGASCAISVDVASASAGIYVNTTGDLTSIAGNSGTASDTLTVLLPANLTVAPTTGLDSGGLLGGPFTPLSASYTLTNTGEVDLAFETSRDQTFFDVSPSNGVIGPGASTMVTVTINSDADTLDAGNYTGTATFTNVTNGMGNTTREVKLAIFLPSDLMVTPFTGLTATGTVGGPFTPDSVVYTLENTGGVPLDFTAVGDQTFFDVSPAGGTINAGETLAVTVSLNATADGLAAGVHPGEVTFTNTTNGMGNTTRPVELTALTPGALVVDPADGLSAGGPEGGPITPTAKTYTLTNTGQSTLDFSAVGDQAFFDVAPASGTLLPGASTTVDVTLNAGVDSLGVGPHGGLASFTNTTNGGGDTTRAVDVTVVAAAKLAVDPLQSFDASGTEGGPFAPGSKLYTLTNEGDVPLNYSVNTGAGWIGLTPSAGALAAGASAVVTAAINNSANGLAPGNFAGQINFVNETNGMGNAAVDASLEVKPKGKIVVRLVTSGGDDSFAFSSPTPELNFSLRSSDGVASSDEIALPEGNYQVTLADMTASGFALTDVACSDSDSSGDVDTRTASIVLAPGELVECVFSSLNSRQKAVDAIHRFLTRRMKLLLASAPPSDRRLERLRGGGNGPSLVRSMSDIHALVPFDVLVTGDALGIATFNFATSLLQARTTIETWRMNAAPDPDGGLEHFRRPESRLDIWAEASYQRFTDSGDSSGHFAVGYVGADYLVSKRLLVGALVQVDDTRDESDSFGTLVRGTGWMAGPYVTARLTKNLYLDVRGAWGQSYNEINPFGTYTDDFDTDRWLASAGLIGDFSYGRWRFRPSAEFAYMREHQKGYTDSLNVPIPGQTVSIGQIKVGPNVSYSFLTESGLAVEPSFNLEGIYSFGDTSGVILGDEAGDDETGLRGRLEVGVNLRTRGGISFGLSGTYDGIGEDGFQAYGGRVRLTIPLN